MRDRSLLLSNSSDVLVGTHVHRLVLLEVTAQMVLQGLPSLAAIAISDLQPDLVPTRAPTATAYQYLLPNQEPDRAVCKFSMTGSTHGNSIGGGGTAAVSKEVGELGERIKATELRLGELPEIILILKVLASPKPPTILPSSAPDVPPSTRRQHCLSWM